MIYFIEPELKNHLLDDQLNPFYTYGIAYSIFASPIVLVVALIITFLADYFLTKKYKNKLVTTMVKKS